MLRGLMSPLALTSAWAFRTLNTRGLRRRLGSQELGGLDGAVVVARTRLRSRAQHDIQ